LLPEPANDSDKRGLGAVVIVAGSSDMSGAAALCARGALAAGAGLVTIATSPLARRLVAPNVPEAMSLEVPSDDPDAAFERVAAACERADALAIGPGLGHEPPQTELVRRCVDQLDLPTIVDADGINAFRHDAKTLADHAADTLVITPHRSELSRLLADDANQLWPRRIEWLADRARVLRTTVVAKGPGTVIAAPDGRVWIDAMGTVALATGGTGDVLTGMTVAALAAGTDPARVAATVALHGLAGQAAAAAGSVRSVTSLDVARAVPHALRRAREVSDRGGA
jgi:NAD(P)H-hydrate epimerase